MSGIQYANRVANGEPVMGIAPVALGRETDMYFNGDLNLDHVLSCCVHAAKQSGTPIRPICNGVPYCTVFPTDSRSFDEYMGKTLA